MPLHDKVLRLPLASIDLGRDTRQRREIDVEDLLPSVRLHGVLVPIIVEDLGEAASPQYRLVAGERRCEASRQAGLPDILARLTSDLEPQERKLYELLENVKRKDLPWTDLIAAVAELHTIYLDLDPEWTQEATAKATSLSPGAVSMYLKVHGEMEDARVQTSGTVREAYNAIKRKEQRKLGDELDDLISDLKAPGPGNGSANAGQAPRQDAHGNGDGAAEGGGGAEPRGTTPPPPPDLPVLCADFNAWAEGYSGPKFNLLHCDFPYGVEVFASAQGKGAEASAGYDDSPEVYWALLKTLLAHQDRFVSLSAHLVFWYDSRYEAETKAALRAHGWRIAPHDLIWFKTDNVGIVADVRRDPRHVYETALLASRGDRHLVQVKGDCYGAPTDKQWHQSTKPEPMLKHFLTMLVDENTRLLDPTCGAGSALRAAEALGAGDVRGLDREEVYVARANELLRKARALRAAEAAAKTRVKEGKAKAEELGL